MALAGLDGRLEHIATGRHARRDPRSVLASLASEIATARARHRRRVRIVSVAVAGTVQHHELVQASSLGWGKVQLGAMLPHAALPLVVGNDATLAGVAEARVGAGFGARAVLHLTVEVGIGGILVVHGDPVTGATGAGGEFGHVPFGPSDLTCPCGARGCWDILVDGRAMARHLGEPPPANPRTFARAVLDRAATDRAASRAAIACATALGTGTAGLVNALDPDLVTLGGLAVPLQETQSKAFEESYLAALMTFRRQRPPVVKPAFYGEDGALQGAAEVGLDRILTEDGLASWAGGR
jgi:predicted NBD/HSP70 family sugar kinase